MIPKKLLLSFLLLLLALSVSAQADPQSEDAKTVEYRQTIGIDYTIPDFNTKKIDGKIIGTRLAKMLQKLQDNPTDVVYDQRLSHILCEQNDRINYAQIENFRINQISKLGDVITIQMRAWLDKNASNLKTADFNLSFTKGVSDSRMVNDLFAYLSKYLKE